MKAIISLCDFSKILTLPWREAGHSALHIDPQHEDNGTILEMADRIRKFIATHKIGLVAGFPPCTDTALSGAANFKAKRERDKYFQHKACLILEQCRMVGALSGAPWFFEQPMSIATSVFGRPDYKFHPWEFGGYLPEDDLHPLYPDYHPPQDKYPKETWIWTGNGFELPEKKPVTCPPGYSKLFKKLGGKSLKTKNIRSATPRGFSSALFLKYANNHPNIIQTCDKGSN